MTPAEAAAWARVMVAEKSGHAAHLAFDEKCIEVLHAAGYGEFADIFERAVAGWHDGSRPYPLAGVR